MHSNKQSHFVDYDDDYDLGSLFVFQHCFLFLN